MISQRIAPPPCAQRSAEAPAARAYAFFAPEGPAAAAGHGWVGAEGGCHLDAGCLADDCAMGGGTTRIVHRNGGTPVAA